MQKVPCRILIGKLRLAKRHLIVETICLPAGEGKKNHRDMVQFGIIPQRFKQEVGRGQGRAAGHGKQEASRNAG